MCLDCMREWVESIDSHRDDPPEPTDSPHLPGGVYAPPPDTIIRLTDVATLVERLENCERRRGDKLTTAPRAAPSSARLRAARVAFETHLRAGGFDVGDNTWDHVRENSPEVVDLWLAVVSAVQRELLGDDAAGEDQTPA